ncbi:hypothetical protein NHQ30_004299 [Ciborinia camelliae]|nr:hypothetical protein NHQ30_004299 [Ciborinia camelliae]
MAIDQISLPQTFSPSTSHISANTLSGYLILFAFVLFLFVIKNRSVDTKSTSSWLLGQNPIAKLVTRRMRAWAYLFNGPGIIQESYRKSHEKPFEVLAPDARMLFVSDPAHIKELDNAPANFLSLNGATKHMLQPLYTMNGFNWFDRRGVEGVGFPLPDLGTLTNAKFSEMRAKNPVVNSFKDKFISSALTYVEQTLINAEIVKLMPVFMLPLVGGILSRRLSAHRTFFSCLIPVAKEHVRERELQKIGHTVPKHADFISWIIETAPKGQPWSAERVIYELITIWFGSVHILSTTIVYAIHDLCFHPEDIGPMREELKDQYAEFERSGKGLPLLDSFMKESARLTPVESNARAKQPTPSKITDVDNSFLMWGTRRMSCPGRYYATAFIKVVLAQLILNYDFGLVEPGAPRWMIWRAVRVPKSKTMGVFTSLEAK